MVAHLFEVIIFSLIPGKSTFVPLKSTCIGLFIERPALLGRLSYTQPRLMTFLVLSYLLSPLYQIQNFTVNVLSHSFFCVLSLSVFPLSTLKSVSLFLIELLHAFTKHTLSEFKSIFWSNLLLLI